MPAPRHAPRASARRADPHRKALLARLHIAAKERGLDIDTYRDLLERETGKRSAGDLDTGALERVLAVVDGGGISTRLKGPYAGKLVALWLSGWHLGVVRDPSDAALTAFVKRQTGLDAVQFLREAGSARRAIEALKSWLGREAGVAWGEHPDNPRRAVAEAQWRRLMEAGALWTDLTWAMSPSDRLAAYAQRVTGKTALDFLAEEDWDALIRALGRKLRPALNKEART